MAKHIYLNDFYWRAACYLKVMRLLRPALRQLRLSPGFSIATILTMALGIGATTAIFSLVNAVLLRPLPFPQPDRLAWVSYDDSAIGGNQQQTFSYPNYLDHRAQNHSFSGLASYHSESSTLTTASGAREIDINVVSANFFRVLGARPVVGRDFRDDEEKPGTHVAILSWDLWQQAFSGASSLVGGTITLDQEKYTVAGVMPADFMFPIQSRKPALWTSLADDFVGKSSLGSQRGAGNLDLVGRLKPGVTVAQAHADLDVIAGNLAAQYPAADRTLTHTIVQPQLDHLVGDSRPALRVLFAAVSFLLLIACVNVAGLLLARASRRRAEVAIRTALGAGSGEIVRQVLTESLVLAACGGALGIGLAIALVAALGRYAPANLPRLDRMSIDLPVLLFAMLISIASGVLFGMLPAWRMSRLGPLDAMRDGGRTQSSGRKQQRLHGALIVAETAIGLVLLVGSGLLIRSFVRVLNVNPGFDSHNVLTLNMALPGKPYDRAHRLLFYDELARRVAALPGVESVAAGWPLPLSGSDINIGFEIDGHPNVPGAEPTEYLAVATPGFFHAMRIGLKDGREFTSADTTESRPVMIINEAFARKYFAGQNPIGKKIKPGISDGIVKPGWNEIVGVVSSVKRADLTEGSVPMYYLPWAQAVITWPTLTVRTAGDPAAMTSAVRATVADMDREIPVYGAKTLDDVIYKAAATPRFQTFVLASFAGLALLLAAIGLYGVLSYMVAQRSREIGVRIAVGAQRSDVLSLILRRGLRLALVGIATGLGASALLTSYMSGMLYQTQAVDPWTFAAVSAILLVVSMAASCGPAIRATRVDPMNVLRDQ